MNYKIDNLNDGMICLKNIHDFLMNSDFDDHLVIKPKNILEQVSKKSLSKRIRREALVIAETEGFYGEGQEIVMDYIVSVKTTYTNLKNVSQDVAKHTYKNAIKNLEPGDYSKKDLEDLLSKAVNDKIKPFNDTANNNADMMYKYAMARLEKIYD